MSRAIVELADSVATQLESAVDPADNVIKSYLECVDSMKIGMDKKLKKKRSINEVSGPSRRTASKARRSKTFSPDEAMGLSLLQRMRRNTSTFSNFRELLVTRHHKSSAAKTMLRRLKK